MKLYALVLSDHTAIVATKERIDDVVSYWDDADDAVFGTSYKQRYGYDKVNVVFGDPISIHYNGSNSHRCVDDLALMGRTMAGTLMDKRGIIEYDPIHVVWNSFTVYDRNGQTVLNDFILVQDHRYAPGTDSVELARMFNPDRQLD